MMYEEIRAWHTSAQLDLVAENLKKRGFTAVIKETREEIVSHVVSLIPAGASVGVGGSVTVRELGIPASLAGRGNPVFDHWQADLTKAEIEETRHKQLTADFFLTGTNALTLDGRLVNIDGTGNRVAAMSFGPRHVIVIAGANRDRARSGGSPLACQKRCLTTELPAPGAQDPLRRYGPLQSDCGQGSTVCRITTILEYRPGSTEYTVILSPLALGL